MFKFLFKSKFLGFVEAPVSVFEQQSIETLESKKELGNCDDLITYAENQ